MVSFCIETLDYDKPQADDAISETDHKRYTSDINIYVVRILIMILFFKAKYIPKSISVVILTVLELA